MEKILQFKFLENITEEIKDEEGKVIETIEKKKYEFLGTSNTKLPDCDYMIESYTQEELEQIQTDGFILVASE